MSTPAFEELVAKAKVAGQTKPPPLVPSIEKAVLPLVDWLGRDLPPSDPLLGHWLTTTSRVLFTAPTGTGKSLFWVAAGVRIAGGFPFLRWAGRRPCKVLYVDGEMSNRLLKERLADEAKRLGVIPAGFHALNHQDVENFAPINTPEGQNTIEEVIKRIGGVEFIEFDNIMSLITGDMKDEESWRQTLPFQLSLTRRNIGQAWLHHRSQREAALWHLDPRMAAGHILIRHPRRAARDRRQHEAGIPKGQGAQAREPRRL
jgi:hypothetical protein